MKKTISTFALLIFAITGFCQILKPVKIDSLVTVSLPADRYQKDTLGQHIISANGLVGVMEIIKAPNVKNTAPLKKESDLNNVLKDYIKTLVAQSGNGAAQNIRDTTIGTLKAKLFTIKQGEDGGIELRNFLLIYTTEATYTFEYTFPDYRISLVADEYKNYVNSIKFSPQLQRDDQYLFKTAGLNAVAKIAIYGGGALLIGMVVFLVTRKRKLAV